MDGKLVLMIPYEQMEHRIALTAWRTLDAFDQFDGKRVQAFIHSHSAQPRCTNRGRGSPTCNPQLTHP